jgi:hypothetical protein
MSRLGELPAIAQMAERGARFVLWRHEMRNGKETKVPLRVNGDMAASTRSSSWSTLAECKRAAGQLPNVAGLGFVLAAERDAEAGQPPIVGIDLDGCRDPDTGEIEAWASEIILELNSYTEVSPSGTGVKIYCCVDPVPQVEANKLVIRPANGHGKAAQIEIFTTARYFAVTEQHLGGTPDEITDATEAFERLAARLAREAKRKGGSGATAGGSARGFPSEETMQRLLEEPALAKLWRGEKDEGDRTASGLDWSLARALGRAGIAADEIARVLCRYSFGQLGSGKLQGRASSRRLGQLVDAAEDARRAPAGSDQDVIQLIGGELHTITARAAAKLGLMTGSSPFDGYYRRGNLLVRPARLADADELNKGGIRRARGALVIATAEPDGLRLTLTAAVRWEKFDARKNKWVPTDAPSVVANAVLATAQDWSDIPILTGIVEAPTLRPDSTVLDQPGYDATTGLLFDPGGTAFPRVPDRPSRQQAEHALASLREIIAGFPFVEGASESVAFSGLITPRVRKACRAVPLHAISAPKMASGKTLLATIAGYIGSGRAPAMMSQADDPTDERKRLLAVLLEGQEINVIDNVERELKSDALCSALTEPRFSDRLLGASKTVTVPSAATWFVTGNNLVVAGDLTARSISCALDPACERPEEREFQVDLHRVVPERRAELAVAALTIVRAYLAAGEPDVGIPNFARFEDWSRFVRRPLVWLGMEDPCKGRERIEGRDPVRAQLGALLEAWNENYPGDSATVAEAIKRAKREPLYINGLKESDIDIAIRERLYDAMREIAGKGTDIDARMLGNFISKHELRFEGNFRFEKAGTSHKVTRWKAVGGGLGGLGGSSLSAHEKLSGDILLDSSATDPPNPPNPPDGGDVEGWLALLRQADGWTEKTAILSAWAKAAGCEVKRTAEGKLALFVPRILRRSSALIELTKHADSLGLALVEHGTRF